MNAGNLPHGITTLNYLGCSIFMPRVSEDEAADPAWAFILHKLVFTRIYYTGRPAGLFSPGTCAKGGRQDFATQVHYGYLKGTLLHTPGHFFKQDLV